MLVVIIVVVIVVIVMLVVIIVVVIGCVRLGNPGFRFSKSKSGFPNRRISSPRNPSSGWISIKKSKSGFFGFHFLSFDWGIRKRICKTVLVNS